VHSERRRRALLFVFVFVFVFFANDTQKETMTTEMGKKRFPRTTTTLESFFVSPVSSKMARKSDDFDFFSRFFGQTIHAESGCCCCFLTLRRTEERTKKEI
jgi:F0F1-type ATP synthase membrane subunit a